MILLTASDTSIINRKYVDISWSFPWTVYITIDYMIDDFHENSILKSYGFGCKSWNRKECRFAILLRCNILISGVISNTRALNYTESHSYVLSVVAQDCGLNKSKPLLVTVEVKQACSTGWSGMVFIVISKSFYFSITKYWYFDMEKYFL